MNCYEFRNGEPDSAGHLNECPACAVWQARQEQLRQGLRALGEDLRRIEAPPRVERAVVAAFRGEATPGGYRRRGAGWLIGAWAAALAATIFLAVAVMRPHSPDQTRKRARSLTQLATVEMPATAAVAADLAEGEFLPLPNADMADTADGLNYVRVELPRSAMIPLGYSVPADRAAETVEADVMLDADGVARAVRFVDAEKGSTR